MLRTISATPSPLALPASSGARSGYARSSPTEHSEDNGFSQALRGAHDQSNRSADTTNTTIIPQSNGSAKPQESKADASRKRASKGDDADGPAANSVGAQPTPQAKDSPLTALLSLSGYRRQPSAETETQTPQGAATDSTGLEPASNTPGTPTALSAGNDVPPPFEPATDNDAIAASATQATGGTSRYIKPTDVNAADTDAIPLETADTGAVPTTAANTGAVPVKVGDGKTAASTNERTQSRAQSITVPLSYYPILQAGIGWGSAAAAFAAPVNANVMTASTAAINRASTGSESDPPIPAARPAAEPATPALPSNNTAFAIRLGAGTPQAKTSESTNLASAPKLSLDSPSIAALDQSPKDSGKSQSDDTSSGQNSSFGMAYSEPALATRSASDKPVFTDSVTGAAAATEETAAKPTNSDPVRNLLLQLKGDDNRRIDVRLVERAGELHVAVKSADPMLADKLQQQMPELTSKLEAAHFTHEVWMPKLSGAARSESGSSSGNASSDGNTNFGQSPDSTPGRRQNGQSESRPDWVDLLENQIS